MDNDEIMTRAETLERLGVRLDDPHLYAICTLDSDTFDAMIEAICEFGRAKFSAGWNESKKIALAYERARIAA